MSPDAEKKITQALAKHVFNVPAANVVRSTGVGQSNLVNHQVRACRQLSTCRGYTSITPRYLQYTPHSAATAFAP